MNVGRTAIAISCACALLSVAGSTDRTSASKPGALGEPTATPIPVFAGPGDVGWTYLGGWTGDGWISGLDADRQYVVPPDEAGRPVRVTGLGVAEADAMLGALTSTCLITTGPLIDAEIAPPTPPGYGYSAVALPGEWPLRPRPVAEIQSDDPIYRAAGQAAFAVSPVDASLGEVAQIVLADLDADGADEAVVAFEFAPDTLPGDPGVPGHFAAMVLVDPATGASSTITSNFIDQASTSGGASSEILVRSRILDVVDLNGDSTLEVLVSNWYLDGASVFAYEYDGTTLAEVFGSGCAA